MPVSEEIKKYTLNAEEEKKWILREYRSLLTLLRPRTKKQNKQKKQIFFYEKMLKPIRDFVVADNVRNDSIKYFHTLAASYLKSPPYEAKQAQQVE